MAVSTIPRECVGCHRTTRQRLARGLCTACYNATYLDDANPVDPNGLAWTTTRPDLHDADHTWWNHARCNGLDTNLFFPERGEPTRPAKEVCRTCPVRDRCLQYAMANNEKHGIWGGRSERERRELRRLRNQGVEAA